MARPSKAKSPKAKFAIFQDADSSIPTPHCPEDDDPTQIDSQFDISEYTEDNKEQLEDIAEDLSCSNIIGEQTDTGTDDDHCNNEDDEDRRESTLTRRTSISSLPESSVFDTDYESRLPAMHKPYTPPSMRPTFRRPESVRRMQLMASPTPYDRSSPRRSALHAKSRTGTPRSMKQSPRPRTPRYQEEDEEEEQKKEYPLVLLHVTLLPVELRWSAESMLDILPPRVIENLQLLRSKVTETILHRGILIPHPREEYELLEDRLLEALELRKERVTKCGHFRARDSTSSLSSGGESVESADSGVGSSLDGDAVERCTTCSNPVRGTATAVDVNGRKWSIKVFAANGLMRASAWTAAWSEMERVDVEILPWISEDLRKQLDARVESEEDDECRRREDEEGRIKAVVEEQVRIAHEGRKTVHEMERATNVQRSPHLDTQPQTELRTVTRTSDLPRVYRAADIPLSILLRNYVFLLAQDKRNVAIFALAMLAIWMSLRTAVLQPPMADLVSLPSYCGALPGSMFAEPKNGAAIPATEDQALDDKVNDSATIKEVMHSTRIQEIESMLEPEVVTGVARKDRMNEEDAQLSFPSSKSRTESAARPLLSIPEDEVQHLCANHDLVSEIFASGASSWGGI